MDIEAIKAALKAAQDALKAAADKIAALADDASDEDVRSAEEAFANAEKDVESRSSDLKRAETRARAIEVAKASSVVADVRVTKNESVYRRDRGGFLSDIYAAERGDSEARARLNANNVEQRSLDGGSTDGGEFTPPAYLKDAWVEASRSNRPFANAIKHLPLPADGGSITLPALTSGSSTSARAGGGSVSNTDPVTGNKSAQVVEVSGNVDVDRIVIERSAPSMEEVVFDDLYRSYAESLEAQLFSGTGNGSNGLHMGLLTVSGTNALTYTSAAPTVPELFVKIMEAVSKAASTGKRNPNIVIMHPRRWYWMIGGVDVTYRQFITQHGSNNNYAQNDQPLTEGYVGNIQGVPILVSHGVPTNLGTGTNQDAIIVANRDEFALYEEGSGVPRSVRFDSVGSGTGAVRLGVFGFSAFFGNRRPAAVSKVTGTGLVDPVFAVPAPPAN